MFELLYKMEKMGDENVIQVITNKHSSYVLAGKSMKLLIYISFQDYELFIVYLVPIFLLATC